MQKKLYLVNTVSALVLTAVTILSIIFLPLFSVRIKQYSDISALKQAVSYTARDEAAQNKYDSWLKKMIQNEESEDNEFQFSISLFQLAVSYVRADSVNRIAEKTARQEYVGAGETRALKKGYNLTEKEVQLALAKNQSQIFHTDNTVKDKTAEELETLIREGKYTRFGMEATLVTSFMILMALVFTAAALITGITGVVKTVKALIKKDYAFNALEGLMTFSGMTAGIIIFDLLATSFTGITTVSFGGALIFLCMICSMGLVIYNVWQNTSENAEGRIKRITSVGNLSSVFFNIMTVLLFGSFLSTVFEIETFLATFKSNPSKMLSLAGAYMTPTAIMIILCAGLMMPFFRMRNLCISEDEIEKDIKSGYLKPVRNFASVTVTVIFFLMLLASYIAFVKSGLTQKTETALILIIASQAMVLIINVIANVLTGKRKDSGKTDKDTAEDAANGYDPVAGDDGQSEEQAVSDIEF